MNIIPQIKLFEESDFEKSWRFRKTADGAGGT